jgi:hypothetical protein
MPRPGVRPSWFWTAEDLDGITDIEEGRFESSGPRDTDGDGTPDYQDLDSDGDGAPPALLSASGST